MKALTFFFIFLSGVLFGQKTKFPAGAYLSFDDLEKKEPTKKVLCTVEKRTKKQIKGVKGNDYVIKVLSDSISKESVKKEYLAFSVNDSLFINGYKFGLSWFYCYVIKEGTYTLFLGGLPTEMDSPLLKQCHADSLKFGDAALFGAGANSRRFYYVLNGRKLETVDKKLMQTYLVNYPDLYSQFEQEPVFDSKVILKYIDKLNALE